MPSSGMRQRVALVRTDVSDEPIASIIRVLVTINYVPRSLIRFANSYSVLFYLVKDS
jgi:hypothetical protein